MNLLSDMKIEIENGYKQLDKELSSATKSQIDEYERIRKLYENTKTVALNLQERIKSTEGILNSWDGKNKKELIFWGVITALVVIFDTTLILKIALLLFISLLIISSDIKSKMSWERKMVDRDEMNLQFLINDMNRYGIDKFNHQIYLHNDFIKYEEQLRGKGLNQREIEKDEQLEEKFKKLELENVEILIEIIENVKSNKRQYYVKVEN